MENNNLFNDDYDSQFYLPKDFIGSELAGNQYITGTARKWTEDEEDWALMLKSKGFTNKLIAKYLYRSVVQVSIKIKRLNKIGGEKYNEKHREEKYRYNNMFLDIVNPKSVLDLYSGQESFYKGKVDKLVTNDKNVLFNCDYNEDAHKLLCKLYYENAKFDLIDLDPFGSPYDCLDLSIKMAKNGLITTIGEMGHRRFKRLDFVRNRYGIDSISEFTSGKICNEIIKIGERNKKKLIPVYVADWKGISRIYFKIEKNLITEFWKNDNK